MTKLEAVRSRDFFNWLDNTYGRIDDISIYKKLENLTPQTKLAPGNYIIHCGRKWKNVEIKRIEQW